MKKKYSKHLLQNSFEKNFKKLFLTLKAKNKPYLYFDISIYTAV